MWEGESKSEGRGKQERGKRERRKRVRLLGGRVKSERHGRDMGETWERHGRDMGEIILVCKRER